ncbi:MAG: SLBB domain-containing protein [Desulfobacterales bacterium]|nr:SLBB domain-containing protein [Desulfobacterales bacterium]
MQRHRVPRQPQPDRSGTPCRRSWSGKGLLEEIKIIETGCNGFCAVGPVMLVQPEGIFYQKLTPEIVPHLVEEHFLKGRPVKKLLYVEPASKKTIPKMDQIPFFANQMFWVMRNKGVIDPEVIDEYIARDGYFGAAKALTGYDPRADRRGGQDLGSAGTRRRRVPHRSEMGVRPQEPGRREVRALQRRRGRPRGVHGPQRARGRPARRARGHDHRRQGHRRAPGLHLCAHRVPAGHPSAWASPSTRPGSTACSARTSSGTGFDFDIDIYQGAGAFVCGEETALMRSIEGKRGMPRPRPPFPALKGLWEKPTILNNVETLASIAQIILNGGQWYAGVGTEGSKGTKVFALSGDVNNIGLVEVPMGTPLRKLIFDIGGGIPDKKKFKAVQLGGPSGGCVPEQYLDIPVDYEEIAKVGRHHGLRRRHRHGR